MAHQTSIEGGAKIQYEKPAIIYRGVFENPMGTPIGDTVDPLEPEFRAEWDNTQNWLRSFVDLLRAR